MVVNPRGADAEKAELADDERTIREEPNSINEDDDHEDSEDDAKMTIHEQDGEDAVDDHEKFSRPASKAESIRVSENPSAPEADIGENPDGGLRAWMVVFGVRPTFISSSLLLMHL